MNKTIFATTFLLSIVVLTTAVVAVGVTPTAFAQNSDFIYNPENGSHYLYVDSSAISWIQANVAADAFRHNGVNGHLVTITSASENDFVADLVPENSRVWIGLTDETTEGTYQWVTDEPYSYSNWDVNQPDDYNNEDYVEFLESSGKWNDLPNYSNDITGFVVEYPISISNTDPVLNPENGHYYEYIIGHEITWHDAKTAAESRTYNGIPGHLVTITSQSENDFVANLSQDDFRPWIGLSDETTEGEYKWVTGEPFSYSYWNYGEPNNTGGNENYVEFLANNDTWNDNTNNNHYVTGYVIEYEIIDLILNPTNGHYYKFIADNSIFWNDAKAAAENSTYNGKTGHLVTITSESENDFVAGLLPENYFSWIGLTDEVTEGEFKWVTGEPFDFSSWEYTQPDNYNDNEDYVIMFSTFSKWYDTTNNYKYVKGYVVEYDD